MSERQRRGGKNRLAEIEKPRGYERGLVVDEIVGATDYTGELMFLVRWQSCDELDLLPAEEVNAKNPQDVIQFYEKRCPLNAKAKQRTHPNVPIAAKEKELPPITKPEPVTEEDTEDTSASNPTMDEAVASTSGI